MNCFRKQTYLIPSGAVPLASTSFLALQVWIVVQFLMRQLLGRKHDLAGMLSKVLHDRKDILHYRTFVVWYLGPFQQAVGGKTPQGGSRFRDRCLQQLAQLRGCGARARIELSIPVSRIGSIAGESRGDALANISTEMQDQVPNCILCLSGTPPQLIISKAAQAIVRPGRKYFKP